jgi:hypothetical protein
MVLKLDPAWRADSGSGRPGTGTGPGWRKTGEEKTQCDPADSAKPGYKPVDFCFFY